MIIDHFGLAISDYEKSKDFYTKALAPLGITLIMEVKGWAGFGKNGKPEFWFGPHHHVQHPMHFAFLAEDRQSVQESKSTGINHTQYGSPPSRG